MTDEREPGRRAPRHLPAIIRYAVLATLGALVAALTSYLLRKIGF